MAEQRPTSQIVVIGASAGGVEALSALVQTFPTDLPAPIVVAQHLDPNRMSHLGEILAARSTLPVQVVSDVEQLQPGVIYVVPANRDVEITDHEVRLREQREARIRPSVDLLLTTAAAVFGEGVIAIILSGTGSDGAAGARAVKAAGGTVVIQNPDTASFPGMPLSLAPTTVDVIANLESIGTLINDLLTGAYIPDRPDQEQQLRTFLEQLRERSGIDFSAYKTQTINRRLQHRMAATGSENLAAYIRHLQRHPEEYQRLISTFLIKVTEFFRDPELFDYLREHVLAELGTEALRRGELRLWSAGCATGEEAYSLAILVHELLADELEGITVRIFATDLDADAVAFARRGIYPPSALSALAPDMIQRYFTRIDGAYEVSKPIRSLLVFGQHDLGQRAPFPRIDLALCRNVLIYFTADLQKRALQLFAFSLRAGGYLVLGKAETVNPLAESFALEHPRLKVYRRVGDRILIPPARVRDSTPSPLPRQSGIRSSISGLEVALSRMQREAQRIRAPGERSDGVLLRLPIGVVQVDRRYDILSINSTARRLLGVHTSAIGEDLIHLVQGITSNLLRGAVDRALKGENSTTIFEVAATEPADQQSNFIEITAVPDRFDGDEGSFETVTLVVADVTDRTRERQALEQDLANQEAETSRLSQQIERTSETNRLLLAANQELTTANAELRSGNEELLVANEEVQAATEEVETLNEELQATNEELETLNEELQATVEELNTTNDDLEARSVELQELAVSLDEQRRRSETERARLGAILSGLGDAVVVVTSSGERILTNAAFDRIFGSEQEHIEAGDESGRPLAPDATPEARAARGESFSMEFTVTGADGELRHFEAIARPVTPELGPGASVLVIRDITERSLRRLQDQFLAMASHELRTPLTALRGYLQLLERGIDPSQERPARYVRLSLDQVQRLATHVSELMDVARLRSGQLQISLAPLDLVELVHQSVETAKALDSRQQLSVSAPTTAIEIEGDAPRLEQVLLNLIGNAITYAPDSDVIEVSVFQEDGFGAFSVKDFGPGIQAEDQERIFSRFSHAEGLTRGVQRGLGLGLYISREIVETHAGSITVESTPGEGSTFTVRLPLRSAGRRPASPSPELRRRGAKKPAAPD